MARLTELIKQLEKLDGPDRRHDGAVHNAIFGTEYGRNGVSVTGFSPSAADYGTPVVPAYTASLDAAIALCEWVLPGWSWTILANKPIIGDRYGNVVAEGPFTAFVNNAAFRPEEPDIEHEAKSASSSSIALVIAILRALAEQEKGG